MTFHTNRVIRNQDPLKSILGPWTLTHKAVFILHTKRSSGLGIAQWLSGRVQW